MCFRHFIGTFPPYIRSKEVRGGSWICTWEDEVQQDRTLSVLDAAHGWKVNVQDEEKDAAKETGHAHSDTVVTGVSVVVEDAEQTLAANVDVALVHDAAEHHHGEHLQGGCDCLNGSYFLCVPSKEFQIYLLKFKNML